MITLNLNSQNTIVTRLSNLSSSLDSFLFKFVNDGNNNILYYNITSSISQSNYQEFELNLSGSVNFKRGWYTYTIGEVPNTLTTSSLDVMQELEVGKCFVSGSLNNQY